MKRILWPLLLILLLCGCTVPQQEETTLPPETTLAPTQATEPPGSYLPNSEVEKLTQSAVRCYLPDISDAYGMATAGADVLLFSGTDVTTLTRLSGDTLYVAATAQLGCMVYPEDSTFRVSANGITYYDHENRELIFLDNDLKEVNRLDMSAEMVGKPVLSSNRLKVYYCTVDSVRVYDLETGLDRLLKSISYPEQSVEDILLKDQVVCCRLVDDRNEEYSIFISGETGEMLAEIRCDLHLTTHDDRYYASIREGMLMSRLFGTAGEAAQMLIPENPFGETWFLEEAHGAVSMYYGEQSGSLAYYDLETGLQTAAVELPAAIQPWYIDGDQKNGYVYLLGLDAAAEKSVLLRWELAKTLTGSETVYTAPHWTEDAPDEAGLARCREYADALEQTHGVQILVGADAVGQKPRDYQLEMEYHVPVIQSQLQQLEQLLACFPEGFFEEIFGEKKICIVRSITGDPESGSLAAASGIQFWEGETAYVVLGADENISYSFFHEMFHVIDSHVLSNCGEYYYWRNLNPEGFKYFEDYTSYLTAQGLDKYLTEEDRAFIDTYSMSYAKEDRARIMEYACNPGNASWFQSEIMQEKLESLCRGIRLAFGLKDYQGGLLWEQYLKEPLKFKKK